MADNPGLQVAASRLNAAAAAAEATRAAAGPTVVGAGTSTYQRYTEHGIVPPQLAGKRKLDTQLTLNFSYDFDFWGKHAAELRAVLAQGKAVQAEQYSARLILAGAVAQSWLQLGRQSQQLRLAQRQLDARNTLNTLTQKRIAAGLDTQTDLQNGTQQIEMLRAEQVQLQQAIAQSRNQLAALLGKGPDRGLLIEPPQMVSATSLQLPTALPLELLGRRPDIVAARWRVEAVQGEIDTARAQFYPNVNLNAFVGLSSFGLANLFTPGSLIAGVGPAFRLPIFEGGALRAQLKGRIASYDAAVASYNQTLTDALREVTDQMQSLQSAIDQRSHQQLAAEAAAQAVRLAEQRQRVGTGNRLQVLTAQATLLQQQRIELDSQLRIADARLGLIKALGGGFDAQPAGLALPIADGPSVKSSPLILPTKVAS